MTHTTVMGIIPKFSYENMKQYYMQLQIKVEIAMKMRVILFIQLN